MLTSARLSSWAHVIGIPGASGWANALITGGRALVRPDESGNDPVLCGWLPQPSGQAVTAGVPQSRKAAHGYISPPCSGTPKPHVVKGRAQTYPGIPYSPELP